MVGKSRTGSDTHAIAALAGRQHGVVSRSQLRTLGFSDSAITARLKFGYLQRLFRGTFAVGHSAVTRRARMLAAVLACGDHAVLSHRSAAELIGLSDRRQALIDVIPPTWAGREIQGIRWHRVRLPIDAEVEIREGIPCTSTSRTLVDVAGSAGWQSLRALVEQAAVLRLLDVEEIDRILAQGRRRGAPRLRTILASWRSGAPTPKLRSRLEARLFPQLIGKGLPLPRCNVRLQIDDHWLEVDLLWEVHRLAIEADGEETHGTRAAFQRDRWRDQLLAAAGYRTARVTWRQVVDEPDAVVDRIARMLNPP